MRQKIRGLFGGLWPPVLPLMCLSAVLFCCALGLVTGALLGMLTRGYVPPGDVLRSRGVGGDGVATAPYRVPRPPPVDPIIELTPMPTGRHADTPTSAPTEVMRPDVPSGQTVRTPARQQEPLPTPAGQLSLRGLPANQPLRPATRLVVPGLGVDAPVVLIRLDNGTWPVDHISGEIGHLQGTASPGDASNVVLAGHVTLAQGGDGPFRNLAQLKHGDEIWVYAEDEPYRYVVEYVKVVLPEDVEAAFPTQEPMLTLITCASWNEALHVYDERVVAVASLAP